MISAFSTDSPQAGYSRIINSFYQNAAAKYTAQEKRAGFLPSPGNAFRLFFDNFGIGTVDTAFGAYPRLDPENNFAAVKIVFYQRVTAGLFVMLTPVGFHNHLSFVNKL
jgi:hypothetical protein